MKSILSKIFLLLVVVACNKDEEKSQEPPLPFETQIGANTFGCFVNSRLFYPRDGNGNFGGGSADKGIVFWGDHTLNEELYNEIDIANYKGAKPVARMIIHLDSLYYNKEGVYTLKETNFNKSVDGLMQNYMHAEVFNPNTNTWFMYGSFLNSGKVTITRFDFDNRIVSGTFTGKLRIYQGVQEIDILNGRFDINWSTLQTTFFP